MGSLLFPALTTSAGCKALSKAPSVGQGLWNIQVELFILHGFEWGHVWHAGKENSFLILPLLQYTWGYFFCMFCLWVSSTYVSLLHKWMYITSCWSRTSATKLCHWGKMAKRIFQCVRIPTFEDLLGCLLGSAKTKLSPEKPDSWNQLCHHIADALRQIPSSLSVGSQTKILTVAHKWTSFYWEVLHGQHTCGHMHILSFSHLFGGEWAEACIKFPCCILDVLTGWVAGDEMNH